MRIKIKPYSVYVQEYGYAWTERRWSVELSNFPSTKIVNFMNWDAAVRTGLLMLHSNKYDSSKKSA